MEGELYTIAQGHGYGVKCTSPKRKEAMEFKQWCILGCTGLLVATSMIPSVQVFNVSHSAPRFRSTEWLPGQLLGNDRQSWSDDCLAG